MKFKKKKKLKNPQLIFKERYGQEKLGLMANKRWQEDPRGLLFSLARYKFVSKLFEGKKKILEVGCGDGWYSKIVAQSVGSLTISDSDKVFIEDLKNKKQKNFKYKVIFLSLIHI